MFSCTCICNNAVKEQPSVQYRGRVYEPENCTSVETSTVEAYCVNEEPDSNICLLCQKRLYENENMIKTKCNHIFCLNCFMLKAMKNGKSICPHCNKVLMNMDTKKENKKPSNEMSNLIKDINELASSISDTVNRM